MLAMEQLLLIILVSIIPFRLLDTFLYSFTPLSKDLLLQQIGRLTIRRDPETTCQKKRNAAIPMWLPDGSHLWLYHTLCIVTLSPENRARSLPLAQQQGRVRQLARLTGIHRACSLNVRNYNTTHQNMEDI